MLLTQQTRVQLTHLVLVSGKLALQKMTIDLRRTRLIECTLPADPIGSPLVEVRLPRVHGFLDPRSNRGWKKINFGRWRDSNHEPNERHSNTFTFKKVIRTCVVVLNQGCRTKKSLKVF